MKPMGILGPIPNRATLGVPTSPEVFEVILTTPTWGTGAWVVRPRMTRGTLDIIKRLEL